MTGYDGSLLRGLHSLEVTAWMQTLGAALLAAKRRSLGWADGCP